MTSPLPDDISAVLRSDATAALAALMIISSAHRGLYVWASQAICGEAPHAPATPKRRMARRANGAGRKSPLSPQDADEALIEAMQAAPGDPVRAWAETIGRSKTSTVTGLHRLRDAGRAESVGGKWRLTEAPAPRAPATKWTAPVSGSARSVEKHLT